MTRSRSVRVGVIVGAMYVAVVFATSLLTSHHVRPLFEGIGPTSPYRWVNPPPEFAAGNQPPQRADTSVPIGNSASVNTPDGQVILSLGSASLSHAPDTSANVTIDPVDGSTLGALPKPLRPNGNAYRIAMTYQPSGEAVDALARPGNIILQIPEPAEAIYFSRDGQSWQRLDSHVAGQLTLMGTTFASPGYYLAASSTGVSKSSDSNYFWPGYIAFLALLVIASLFVLRQLRRRRPARPPARSRGRGAPARARHARPSTKKRGGTGKRRR